MHVHTLGALTAAPGLARNISAAASSAPSPVAPAFLAMGPGAGTGTGTGTGVGVASGMPRMRGLPFTSTHASGMHSRLMTACAVTCIQPSIYHVGSHSIICFLDRYSSTSDIQRFQVQGSLSMAFEAQKSMNSLFTGESGPMYAGFILQ